MQWKHILIDNSEKASSCYCRKEFFESLSRGVKLLKDYTFEHFVAISTFRMTGHYLPKLVICLESLSDEQIWEDELNGTMLNSIGGIVLHIVEQVSRNTIRFHNPETIFPKGIEDHFPMMNSTKDDLMETLKDVFSQLMNTLEIVDRKNIDLYNLYHLVEHTSYHLGQIVDRSQKLVGIKYHFVQNGINEESLKELIEEQYNVTE